MSLGNTCWNFQHVLTLHGDTPYDMYNHAFGLQQWITWKMYMYSLHIPLSNSQTWNLSINLSTWALNLKLEHKLEHLSTLKLENLKTWALEHLSTWKLEYLKLKLKVKATVIVKEKVTVKEVKRVKSEKESTKRKKRYWGKWKWERKYW